MNRFAVLGALLVWLAFAVGAHATCPPEGDARPGTIQVHLNKLKNRTASPSNTRPITLGEMLAYPEREESTLETQGVVLKGVLFTYKHEGRESCNCHSKTRRDFHIWITESGARNRKNAVVVELSPPEQDLHPELAASLPALKGKTVCATGWLFFDPEHPPQLGKTRGTLWEIHPVTDIRECQ